jgi:hypothetical protein
LLTRAFNVEAKKMKFLAHIQMRPTEGGAMFTVETQFEADTWHKAWEHVMRAGRSFEATVVWHRILPINEETGEVVHNDGIQSPTQPPLALPPPREEAAAPVPVEPEKWYGTVDVKFAVPAPWLGTLTVNATEGGGSNDQVA